MSNYLGAVVEVTLLPLVTVKPPKHKRVKRSKVKTKKLKRIPRMTYRLYMGSAYWRKRKQQYFSKHGRKCSICGVKKGTTLHHTKYEPMLYGIEPEFMLVLLCQKHHHEYHEAHGVHQDMMETTKHYLIHAQSHNKYEKETEWINHIS
jgi:hypothetical protein